MREKTKKCKYCQTEIPANASICPNCKRALTTTNNLILLTAFIVIMLGVFVVIKNASDNYESQNVTVSHDNSISSNYINVTEEQGIKIDNALRECGIGSVDTFEHDELLDDAHSKGETGYRISNADADNIILYLNKDKSVYSIVYSGNKLYKKNKQVATIQDFVITFDEANKWQSLCKEKVKEILKSPSTAKFPNITEWGFSKEKNKIIVQGYVDSQNSFGAELRSEFQFIINPKKNVIKSFIFDGEELIK